MAWILSSRRWSIRTKGVALVAGYVLALGAVYGAFTYSLLQRETGRARDRLQQTANLVATEIDTYVDAGRQRLALVTQLPGMTYGLRTMQDASAKGRIPPWTTLHYLFFKSQVFTGGVFLVDRDGTVLWTEPPGRPWMGKRLADHPVLQRLAQEQQSVVSAGLDASGLLDRPHVVIAFPVRSPNGEVEGALGGVIDLGAPEITKIALAVASTERLFVEVIDQNGRVIAASDPSRVFQTARATSPATTRDDPWMLATTPLAQAPWRVVAGQPRQLALAEVWQVQRELLVLGVGLLLAALAAGVPIVNRFVRDIRGLTDSAETIARGDLSRPVTIPLQHDEIATLARMFEQMRLEVGRSRAALEQRLQEREELIRLKEEFLASISHELRTPLNAIVGYTDMLADEAHLAAEARSYLAAIRSQSEHLYQLLSDLLTLSGLNVGRLGIEVTPVQVPAVLARLQPLAQRLCEGKDIEVVWDCAASLPTMETDPLRLEEILTNLLTNAVKFTEHGRVTVRVADEAETRSIAFAVSDTGIGIPAAELPYIFDEFRKVDGSSTRVHGGFGLGLTLVKRMAEMLDGEVTVASRVGEGSTFTVRLPLRMQSAARSAA
jgi:signal transduction histidine kinase